MKEVIFANGSVPVSIAAKIYGKKQAMNGKEKKND